MWQHFDLIFAEASMISAYVYKKIGWICSLVLAMCCAGVYLGSTLTAHDQTAVSAAPYTAARENADKQAKEWLARGTPGLALAVAVDGKILYSEAFGFADLEERVPVWPTTKFRIGSISKPLTAMALMQLVEAGKL